MTNIRKNVIDIRILSLSAATLIFNIARITDFYHKTLKCLKSQNLFIKNKSTYIMKKFLKITKMNYNIHKGKASLFIII